MGYPMGLDDHTDAQIHEEHMRRVRCKGNHECSYCGKRLDSCVGEPLTRETGCKLSRHNIPVPAHVATEAVLQGLAMTIDKGLPSGRGFVLSVAHTTEGSPDGSHGSYVSNLSPAGVPEHLRATALYIEEREKRRNTNES